MSLCFNTGQVSIWLSVLTPVLSSGNRDLCIFDLTRALEKTVAMPRQVQELVSIAYSPRLRCILERDLDGVLLHPANVNLAVLSAEDIRRIVERAFNATPFATTCGMGDL